MRDKIAAILTQAFHPDKLEVHDESRLHAYHADAIKSGGGHYSLLIVSDLFKRKNLVERHQMIYNALGPQMKKDIHALAIKAYTTEEFINKT